MGAVAPSARASLAVTIKGQDALRLRAGWRMINQGLRPDFAVSDQQKRDILHKQLVKVTKLSFDMEVYARAKSSGGLEYSLSFLENAIEQLNEREREERRKHEIAQSVSGKKPQGQLLTRRPRRR